MKFRLPILVVLLTLVWCTAFAGGPTVSASHVWIRTAPDGVHVLSGFLTLENHTGKPLKITSISSPDFKSVDIGAAKMDPQHAALPLNSVTLPPHKTLTFKPGGTHLRLVQPHRKLYEGDMVSLTFNFSDGSSLALLVSVRGQAPTN